METSFKVVEIYWTDAFSEDGWKDIAALTDKQFQASVKTIGYLVLENDLFYYVANSVSYGQAACTMAIPKGMVQNIIFK